MSEPALQAIGLEAGYGKIAVVRDLDLELRAGEVLCLFGSNGAGKTTTVRTLAGLLSAKGGEVRLGGEPVKSPLHARARMGLSLVTERRALVKTLCVEENLRVTRSDVTYALELFPELNEHLSRPAGLLSGGQQQMLSLARALARRPSVLLIDELSLGLAPIVVNRLLEAVRKAADDGMAVLLVEQHIGKALRIADRVHVLRRGRVVLDGDASRFRDRTNEIVLAYMAEEEEVPSAAMNGGQDDGRKKNNE
jgi:ABC-type branched-subunit amino acid transport system ATPase component